MTIYTIIYCSYINHSVKLVSYVQHRPWELRGRGTPNELRKRTHIDKLWWNVVAWNSILVVGNAPSVLDVEAGYIVDFFSRVIRLTNFDTKGYEQYVGSRIDDVFISFATKKFNHTFINKKRIHLFAAERSTDLVFLQKRMNQPGSCFLNVSTLDLLSNYYYSDMNQRLGLTGLERLTTGSVALEWVLALQKFDIYTHGVDFFTGQKMSLLHYTKHVSRRDGYHNFEKEQAYFSSYYSNHKLRHLIALYP